MTKRALQFWRPSKNSIVIQKTGTILCTDESEPFCCTKSKDHFEMRRADCSLRRRWGTKFPEVKEETMTMVEPFATISLTVEFTISGSFITALPSTSDDPQRRIN